MSLLTSSTTLATKQAESKATLVAISRSVWNELQRKQQDGMDVFWSNPKGLTPQEMAAACGTDCARMFAFNSALVDFLIAVGTLEGVTPNLKPPTNAFTVNQDGTVTISNDPYAP